MLAKIHRPAKTAMQSGRAKSDRWALDFAATEADRIDPLMGWTSSGDMNQQVRLFFDTKDEAIAYAQRQGLTFEVVETKERKRVIKSYAQNFDYDRKVPWTH